MFCLLFHCSLSYYLRSLLLLSLLLLLLWLLLLLLLLLLLPLLMLLLLLHFLLFFIQSSDDIHVVSNAAQLRRVDGLDNLWTFWARSTGRIWCL